MDCREDNTCAHVRGSYACEEQIYGMDASMRSIITSCIIASPNLSHHKNTSQKSPSSVIDAIAGDDGQYFIVLATSVVCIIERRVEVREGSHLWSVLQSTHQNDGTTTRSLVRAMHVWILCICILATRVSTCDEVFLRYGYVEKYVLVTRN